MSWFWGTCMTWGFHDDEGSAYHVHVASIFSLPHHYTMSQTSRRRHEFWGTCFVSVLALRHAFKKWKSALEGLLWGSRICMVFPSWEFPVTGRLPSSGSVTDPNVIYTNSMAGDSWQLLISSLLWNPKFHHRSNKNRSTIFTQGQLSPVHICMTPETYFNVFLLSPPISKAGVAQ